MIPDSRPLWTDGEPDEEAVAALLRPHSGGANVWAAPCPAPDLLQAAREGTLPGDLQQEVLRHLAHCTICQTLDAALGEVLDEDITPDAKDRIWQRLCPGASKQPRRFGIQSWALLGAAATVVIALSAAVLYQMREVPEAPIDRGAQSSVIRNLVAPEEALPRSACELTWASDLANARYDVFVTDEDLNPLARGTGLDVARFTVPPANLAALAPGSRVLWRVEALLPGGRRVASPTFIARVE